MDIPEQLRKKVDCVVSRSLSSEFGARGLLLSHAAYASAIADVVRSGERLLRRVVEICYADGREGVREVEFDDDQAATRIGLGLAFGSVTASLFSSPRQTDRGQAAAIEVSCAAFNLAAGLIDGLCDGTPVLGLELLRILQAVDLAGAARDRWPAGRLRSALPAPFSANPTVAFTARIIETFLDTLHAGHPGDEGAPVRDRVGALLEEALEAERRTVQHSPEVVTRNQLIEYSRQTSVLPFQIIEHLAMGAPAVASPTAGTLLGEAMWRIDDLVDLAQDVGDGALNAVLAATTSEPWSAGACDGVATLESVITSDVISLTAVEAAERLEAGLAAVSDRKGDNRAYQLFLSFVHRYAGLAPQG
ncbi:hypothetical protein AB0L74_21945 [Streptomyces sp. NPDC052020]|uniref:hypothetical protein n=1 Tax=Streptomyces sp. NPDC052020 TaxID=3155677 RepID=UPI0034335F0D